MNSINLDISGTYSSFVNSAMELTRISVQPMHSPGGK